MQALAGPDWAEAAPPASPCKTGVNAVKTYQLPLEAGVPGQGTGAEGGCRGLVSTHPAPGPGQ